MFGGLLCGVIICICVILGVRCVEEQMKRNELLMLISSFLCMHFFDVKKYENKTSKIISVYSSTVNVQTIKMLCPGQKTHLKCSFAGGSNQTDHTDSHISDAVLIYNLHYYINIHLN